VGDGPLCQGSTKLKVYLSYTINPCVKLKSSF
jgi:hypothetical protein